MASLPDLKGLPEQRLKANGTDDFKVASTTQNVFTNLPHRAFTNTLIFLCRWRVAIL